MKLERRWLEHIRLIPMAHVGLMFASGSRPVLVSVSYDCDTFSPRARSFYFPSSLIDRQDIPLWLTLSEPATDCIDNILLLSTGVEAGFDSLDERGHEGGSRIHQHQGHPLRCRSRNSNCKFFFECKQ